MDKSYIHRTSGVKTNDVMECVHCGRKNLVLKFNGKPAPDQSCTNCWKPFL